MHVARTVVVVVAITCASMASYARTNSELPRYMKELAEVNEVRAQATRIANLLSFKYSYPHILKMPSWQNWRAQKMTEGKEETDVRESYDMFMAGSELSEERIVEVLMEEDMFRAHVLSFQLLFGLYSTHHGDPSDEAVAQLHLSSRYVIPMFLAIERDSSAPLLMGDLQDIIAKDFSISFRKSASLDDTSGMVISEGHLGFYLQRENHIKHKPLDARLKTTLRQLGYDSDYLHNLLSPTVATAMSFSGISPLPINEASRRIGAIDMKMAADLMQENGVVVSGRVSPRYIIDSKYHQQQDILDALWEELGFDQDSSDFAERVAEVENILNDPQRPVSLFQIVQLTRLGFPMAWIRAFTYATCDAIIIASPPNRDKFVASVVSDLGMQDFAIDRLNAVVAEKGELVLMLLQEGYKLEDINPHGVKAQIEYFESVFQE